LISFVELYIRTASLLSSSRGSNNKVSSHQTYLGRYKIKSKSKRRTKKKEPRRETSDMTKSKNIPNNVSFDVSAQIEEIFQVEAMQVTKY